MFTLEFTHVPFLIYRNNIMIVQQCSYASCFCFQTFKFHVINSIIWVFTLNFHFSNILENEHYEFKDISFCWSVNPSNFYIVIDWLEAQCMSSNMDWVWPACPQTRVCVWWERVRRGRRLPFPSSIVTETFFIWNYLYWNILCGFCFLTEPLLTLFFHTRC